MKSIREDAARRVVTLSSSSAALPLDDLSIPLSALARIEKEYDDDELSDEGQILEAIASLDIEMGDDGSKDKYSA